ncbi:aquaporin [Schizopora paradoxa]|uniref:Aquaporin n=1 Tax=Schizopora paradoxa TaxID=27342 RepID=A0A0H2RBD5_9AGAM|nr:aquaporin [Schizopora paradoxa]
MADTQQQKTRQVHLYPHRFSRFLDRDTLQQPVAEFFGTMILVMFGCAGNAQGNLFNSSRGYMDVAFGWGAGLALGVWVAGGVSGGHLNPAVTISQAVFRGFPWGQAFLYMLMQLLGAIVGAALVYANYYHAINAFEGGSGVRTVPGTAQLFGTYASPVINDSGAFFEEFLGTFLLMFVLLAVSDKRSGTPSPGMVPIALFFVLFAIGIAFGGQTGFAVNPARDLGPRILTAMAGYGREVFNFRRQYWLWACIIAPITGALLATLIYDTFLFTGFATIHTVYLPVS